MKIITDKQREQINEMLHDEILKDIESGDSTVLFEIIEGLSHTTAYYSLSDESQDKIITR